MKLRSVVLVFTGVLALAAFSVVSKSTATDGKQIFLDNHCNSCHSIKSQDVAKKADEDADKEAGETGHKPPDLSNVGQKKDAAWISKFLLKQVDLDGEKHRKRFRGSDDDLKVLAGWLESLKADKGGKAEKSKEVSKSKDSDKNKKADDKKSDEKKSDDDKSDKDDKGK